MDFDATQAIPLDDVEDSETDDEIPEEEKKPVAHLKVLKTKGFPETLFPVHEGDNLVGRAESCNILIPLKALSKQHACIEIRGGCHFIYDKGSRNKTKRGKMYLSPEIRYELRNDDEIVFADVKCEYKFVENKEESPVSKPILEFKNTVEESLIESEEASSDILAPTQPYHDDSVVKPVSSRTPVTSKTRDNFVPDSEDEDDLNGKNDIIKTTSKHSVIAETPIVSTKTKQMRESPSKIPDSGSEGDAFKKSDNGEETMVYDGIDDDDSEEREKLKRMSLLATQAVNNSDEECINESDCFDAPTQAYAEPMNNNSKIDHMAPTQAYVMSSDDEASDSPVMKRTPKRSPKGKALEESTLAYTMEVESTQTAQEIKKKRLDQTEGTVPYNMDTESTQTAAEIKSKRKGKASTDGGQATVQYDLDVESTQTAAEIKAKRGQIQKQKKIKEVGSDDDTTDDEQMAAPKSKKRVSFPDQEATQVYGEDPPPNKSPQKDGDDGKNDTEESEKADFACGATLAFDEYQDDDEEEEEEVLIPFGRPNNSSSQGFDEVPTQVFEGETLAVPESPCKSRKEDVEMDKDMATQVLEETSPILKNKNQRKKKNVQEEATTQVLGDDQATQVLGESSYGSQSKTRKISTTKDDDATQVFNENDEPTQLVSGDMQSPKSCKGNIGDESETQVFEDNDAPTQTVLDEVQSPKPSKSSTEDEVATQVYGADFEGETQVMGSPAVKEGKIETSTKSMVEEDAETQVFGNNETLVLEAGDIPKATKTKIQSLKAGRIQSTGSEATVVGTSSEDEKDEPKTGRNSWRDANEDETVSMDEEAPTQVYDGAEEEETHRSSAGKAAFHDAPTQALDTDGFLVPNMPQKIFKKQELSPVPLYSDDIATQPYGADSEEDKTSDSDNFVDHDAPTLAMDEGSPILGRAERKKPTWQDDMATQAYDMDEDESNDEEETSLIQPKPAEPLLGILGDEEPTQAYDIESDDNEEIGEEQSETAKSKQEKSIVEKKVQNKGKTTRQMKKENASENEQPVSEGKKMTRKAQINEKDMETSIEESGSDEVDVGARRPKRGKGLVTVSKVEDKKSKKVSPNEKRRESFVTLPSTSRSRRGKDKQKDEEKVDIENNKNKTSEMKNSVKDDIPVVESGNKKIKDATDNSSTQEKTPAGRKSLRGKHKSDEGAGDAPLTKANEEDQSKSVKNPRMSKQEDKSESETVKRSTRRGGKAAEIKVEATEPPQTVSSEVLTKKGSTRSKRGRGKAAEVDVSKPASDPQPKIDKDIATDDKSKNLLSVPNEASTSKGGETVRKGRARSKSPAVEKSKEEQESSNKRGRSKARAAREAKSESEPTSNTSKSQKKMDEFLATDEEKSSESTSTRSTRGRRSVVPSEVEPGTSKENPVKGKKGAKKDVEPSEQSEGKTTKGRSVVDSTKDCESAESEQKSVKGKKGISDKNDNEDLVKSSKKSPSKKTKAAAKKNLEQLCTNDTESMQSDTESIASSVASETASSTRARSKRKPSPTSTSETSTAKVSKGSRAGNKRKHSPSPAGVPSQEAEMSTTSRGRSKRKPCPASSAVSTQESEPSTTSRARSKRKQSPVSSTVSSSDAETATTSRARSKRKGSPDSAAVSSPAQKRRAISHDETSSQCSSMSANSPSVRRRIKTADAAPSTPKNDPLSRQPSLRVLTPRSGGKKIKVMFTGLIDEQGQKIVKNLGGELVEDINECTHLVTDKVRRTIKFLCAVAKGLPIVNSDWLTSSMKAGSFIDTSRHLIKDPENEAKFSFNLANSLEKAELQGGALTGFKIHATKSVKPPPNDLKEIVKCAGGQYLTTMPKKQDENVLVISCEGDEKVCKHATNAGIPVVSVEFILTGILQQESNIKQYQLFGETTSEERKRGKDPKALSSGAATKRKR